MSKETGKTFQRTIAPELHEAWKAAVRKNDVAEMTKLFQCSRQVVDRAINYGFVTMPNLAEKITNYFVDRLNAEREAAKKLTAASK